MASNSKSPKIVKAVAKRDSDFRWLLDVFKGHGCDVSKSIVLSEALREYGKASLELGKALAGRD